MTWRFPSLLLFWSACRFYALSAKDVEFRLERPDAQTASLAGEFNDWKGQPMTKGTDGVWTITVPLSAGTYAYKFLVNGSEWLFDPQNQQRKQNNGIDNSAIEVTDESALGSVATPAPAATSSDLPVKPGEVIQFDAPLSATEQHQAMEDSNPATTTARIALGVPANFDPAKSWPLLIISATVDASSIELLGAYQQAALEAGWVIMAADGAIKPKDDRTPRRLAMIEAGLDFLAAHWPAAKTWPIAAGGFSGGAKRSGFVAAALMKEQRHVIGILMGGCNEDTATAGMKRSTPPYGFKLLPIFLSSGATDTIASPEMVRYVEHSMKNSGFRNVRFESYPGAHEVYPAHTTAALEWFVAGPANSAIPPPKKSDFDSFFKKP